MFRRLGFSLVATLALVIWIPVGHASAQSSSSIQAVYAVPSDVSPVPGRNAAIRENVAVVQAWFSEQTGGLIPAFEQDSSGASVPTVVLPATRDEIAAMSSGHVTTLLKTQVAIDVPSASGAKLLAIIEGADASGACGYTNSIVVIPVDNCDISPSSPATFPFGSTYLIAHELTHLLGAVPSCAPNSIPGGHVSGDNRDILYQGGARDWDNLMLDPGNDDYYNHGHSDCPDIADSRLFASTNPAPVDPPTSTTTPPSTTPPTTSAPPVPYAICQGQVATIVGTSGPDTLVGTDRADVIAGLGGNDVIRGLGGNDVICAGSGIDFVYGGDGNDSIQAGDGHDRIWGQLGQDTIWGGPGRDSVVGGSGVDTLHGGVGTDRIKGGSASDFMYGENGRDRLLGGPGNDQIRGGGGDDRLYGGSGTDWLNGGNAIDLCVDTAGSSISRCEVFG